MRIVWWGMVKLEKTKRENDVERKGQKVFETLNNGGIDMDIIRAKELLSVLADGINPLTGEVLPEEDSCNQVEVVRALYTVLSNLDTAKNSSRKPKTENAGKPWTESEKAKLEEEYRSGLKISAIAKHHGRSRGAIEAKLAQMGLIDYSYFTGKMR